MALLNTWDELNERGQIGDWCFFVGSDGVDYIAFRHPSPAERGELTHIPITTENKISKHWLWDGNKELPTIVPSIMVTWYGTSPDVKLWHGYITAGKMITV